MGLVAGAVSEVVPTAGRTVDGGFVNSAVRSTSNRFFRPGAWIGKSP